MPLLSKQARTALASKGSGGGNFITPSKIQDKSEARFRILVDEAFECFSLWATAGDGSGDRECFRFLEEPTPEQIKLELGEYVPDENQKRPGIYDIKFEVSLPVYNYATGTVQVLQMTQQTIYQELDAISQMKDYKCSLKSIDIIISKDKSLPPAQIYKTRPVPHREDMTETIDAAWIAVQEEGFDMNRLANRKGNPFRAV